MPTFSNLMGMRCTLLSRGRSVQADASSSSERRTVTGRSCTPCTPLARRARRRRRVTSRSPYGLCPPITPAARFAGARSATRSRRPPATLRRDESRPSQNAGGGAALAERMGDHRHDALGAGPAGDERVSGGPQRVGERHPALGRDQAPLPAVRLRPVRRPSSEHRRVPGEPRTSSRLSGSGLPLAEQRAPGSSSGTGPALAASRSPTRSTAPGSSGVDSAPWHGVHLAE